MSDYTVKQGDCINSIATKYGLFPKKIWDHANNADLKKKRQDPNALLPGDKLFVPEKELQEVSCATGQRHRFRKKGVPAKLRLQLKSGDKPRTNEKYTLKIDNELLSGTTDGEGRIEHPIPPNAKKGKLLVGDNQDEYTFKLGHIDPVDEVSGVQERLNNLGFDCGKADGKLNDATKAALMAFQKQYKLEESGAMDKATIDKLKKVYGC